MIGPSYMIVLLNIYQDRQNKDIKIGKIKIL